jgi:hypothetical protein
MTMKSVILIFKKKKKKKLIVFYLNMSIQGKREGDLN